MSIEGYLTACLIFSLVLGGWAFLSRASRWVDQDAKKEDAPKPKKMTEADLELGFEAAKCGCPHGNHSLFPFFNSNLTGKRVGIGYHSGDLRRCCWAMKEGFNTFAEAGKYIDYVIDDLIWEQKVNDSLQDLEFDMDRLEDNVEQSYR
jgi:hypothetical protein